MMKIRHEVECNRQPQRRNPCPFLAKVSCDPLCALWLGNEYMRIAYLECFSGISGDMFMGALVDAGVPQRLFEEAVAALNVGARLEISRVVRSGISASKVDVYAGGEKDMPREEFWANQIANHDHEHSHGDQGHEHSHSAETARAGAPAPHVHEHSHEHTHEHGRGLREIRQIIGKAAISEN